MKEGRSMKEDISYVVAVMTAAVMAAAVVAAVVMAAAVMAAVMAAEVWVLVAVGRGWRTR